VNRLFDTETDRLPVSIPIRLLRWWIPAATCLVGIAILLIDDFDSTGLDAFAAFVGAGSSIWLINFLWRIGISGDDERDREALDRVYLAKHGHWPDQDDPAEIDPPAPAKVPPS
jgi:hypothetical protein